MDVMSQPESWKCIDIDDVAQVIAGGTPKAGNPDNFADPGTCIAWLTPADLSGYSKKYISHGSRDLSQAGYDSSSAKLMPAGSLLFSSRAPIGYVAVAKNEISTNQGFKNFVFTSGVDSSYAYFYLRSIRNLAESLGSGTTFKEISGATAKKLPFVLPPLAEQKVIADKLDQLLAQVESTKARLDRIPNILKSFRQSVLAAAVSGKLTEEWRASNECDEWENITLDCAAGIRDPHPSHRTPKVVEGGVPYIGIGDLKKDGSIDFDNARKISFDVLKEHQERYQLKYGDFVFGKIGTLGKATVLPMGIDYTLSANVILIQPKLEKAIPAYLMYFLSAPGTMDEVARQANSTSQAAFGIKKMRAFVTRLPSLQEQTEIVRQVEQLFVHADKVEQQVQQAQERVNKLTQSILAKAFRGELTEQWRQDNPDLISGDNSAEVLLAKIKVEREAVKPKRNSKRIKVSA